MWIVYIRLQRKFINVLQLSKHQESRESQCIQMQGVSDTKAWNLQKEDFYGEAQKHSQDVCSADISFKINTTEILFHFNQFLFL